MNLANCDLQVTLILPTKFESTGLSVQEKKFKINFQDGCHLGLLMGTILAIFDLQIILIFTTKFQVNCHFHLGEEVQNRFSKWQLHLGFPI